MESVNDKMAGVLGRRPVPQSLDQRDLKKRRLAPNSSPPSHDLQARYVSAFESLCRRTFVP